MNDFSILGINSNTSLKEVKRIWRQLVKANHPDRATDKAAATRRLAEINAAYDRVKAGAPEDTQPNKAKGADFWAAADEWKASSTGQDYQKWEPGPNFDEREKARDAAEAAHKAHSEPEQEAEPRKAKKRAPRRPATGPTLSATIEAAKRKSDRSQANARKPQPCQADRARSRQEGETQKQDQSTLYERIIAAARVRAALREQELYERSLKDSTVDLQI